jgi:hypothetical protein
VALGTGGFLHAAYIGEAEESVTARLIFDATGYFTK